MSTTPRKKKKRDKKQRKRKSSSRKKGAKFSPQKAPVEQEKEAKYVEICKNLLHQITRLEESKHFHDVFKSDHKLYRQYHRLIPDPMSFSLVSTLSPSLSMSALSDDDCPRSHIRRVPSLWHPTRNSAKLKITKIIKISLYVVD